MKKILIVGNWAWDHCEEAFGEELAGHIERQGELKAILYNRFGKTINLEE